MGRHTNCRGTLQTASQSFKLSQQFIGSLLIIVGLVLPLQAALAVDPVHVSVSLQGCKNTGQNPLYITNFICADSVYTPGNLGKGWNELDLVPFRLTTDVGKQNTATTTYSIAIVLDNENASKPGYDVISVPTVNAALSDASCAISASPNTGAGSLKIPGIGGTDISIYRFVTITQNKETTCVFDYYGRLALGSHLYPGSSLHANLTLTDFSTGGIGARDVSIPVNEIDAQQISKDMTAQQASDFIWSLNKTASSAQVEFGDVCALNAPTTKPIDITVNWTKTPVTAGNTTVITHVRVNNPAARTISVSGNDLIYKGLVQTTLLSTTAIGPINVPPSTNLLVLTNSQSFSPTDSNAGYFNDVATVTYTDNDTNIPIPGNSTATASAQIMSSSSGNNSANISDTESITGNGLLFSVPAPSVGAFTNGYIADAHTLGPVNWALLNTQTSGSITFNKTIYLTPLTVVTGGQLTDTATITSSGGNTSTSDFTVNINSDAKVKLTINKTLPFSLNAGETVQMIFSLTGTGPVIPAELNIVGPYTAGNTASVTVENLVPDNYAVAETSCSFIDAANPAPGVPCNLAPIAGPVNVDLSLVNGVATCSGHADFVNVAQNTPSASVVKVTNPSCDANNKPEFTWDFTLTGPNGYSNTVSANSCDGGVSFGNLADGTYTMTETPRSGWGLVQVTNPDGTVVTQNSCQFTVHVATDGAKVYTCTFMNAQSGGVKVKKTVAGCSTFRQSYTFDIRTGAAPGVPGTIVQGPTTLTQANNPLIFTGLTPGAYQLCETSILSGWDAKFAGYTAFNPEVPPNDNSTLCINITVTADNTLAIRVDNVQKGKCRTTGYWNHCKQLDHTLKSNKFYVGKVYIDSRNKTNLLLSSKTLTGKKVTGDPLFNLAAQFIAAKLNIQAKASSCIAAANALNSAQALLTKYKFNGVTHSALSSKDTATANNLTNILSNYNNNTLPGCSK